MIKHRYITYGVYNNDVMYIGFCIALSLNNAIEIFHKNKCSVWGIYKFHQVHADIKEGLEKIEFSRVMPEECNKEIIENNVAIFKEEIDNNDVYIEKVEDSKLIIELTKKLKAEL